MALDVPEWREKVKKIVKNTKGYDIDHIKNTQRTTVIRINGEPFETEPLLTQLPERVRENMPILLDRGSFEEGYFLTGLRNNTTSSQFTEEDLTAIEAQFEEEDIIKKYTLGKEELTITVPEDEGLYLTNAFFRDISIMGGLSLFIKSTSKQGDGYVKVILMKGDAGDNLGYDRVNKIRKEQLELTCPECGEPLQIEKFASEGENYLCENCYSLYPKNGIFYDYAEPDDSVPTLQEKYEMYFKQDCLSDKNTFKSFDWDHVFSTEEYIIYNITDTDLGEDSTYKFAVESKQKDFPTLLYDVETGFDYYRYWSGIHECSFCGEEKPGPGEDIKVVIHDEEYGHDITHRPVCEECYSEHAEKVKEALLEHMLSEEIASKII